MSTSSPGLASSNVIGAAAGQPRAASEARAHQAIARAAQRTGADFSYLLAQARLESSLDPSARARTSSAAGLYQFIDSTWLETLDRHGATLGYGGAAAAINREGGRARISDSQLRAPIMGLRFDADASALMAGALAQDNSAVLSGVLGRQPDNAELYLAHFLGAGGASRFLSAMETSPEMSAASLFPGPAASNRTIFYAPGGAPRSLGQVMELFRDKMAAAMGDSALPGAAADLGFRQSAGEWHAAAARLRPSPGSPGPRDNQSGPSMSETLRTSFALDARRPSAPDHNVRNAYGKLRALGL